MPQPSSGRRRYAVVALVVTCAAGAAIVVGLSRLAHGPACPDCGDRSARHAWDSFTNEVSNQAQNARSQLASAQARRRDDDPSGAVVDAEEGLRLLGDLPRLTDDYRRFAPVERLEGHLAAKRPEHDALRRDLLLERGRAFADLGTPAALTSALASLREGLAASTSAELSLEVARVQALQGDLGAARETLARLPEDEGARLELARLALEAGEPEQASADCSRLLEQGPRSHRAHLLRGQARFALGRFEEALADFQEAVALDDGFLGHVWRGRAHHALGQWGEALDDLTEAIDLNPARPEGYFHRAELYASQRRYVEAAKDHEVALSRSADFHPARLGLGRALEGVQDDEPARAAYDEVLKATDREGRALAPEAQAALGALLVTQCDPLVCQLEVEERLREEGATPGGAALRAEARRLADDRARRARAAFDEALAGRRDLVLALVGRARLAVASADWARAAADLSAARTALARRPGGARSDHGAPGDLALAEVRSLQGLVALRQGDRGAARTAFTDALDASPSCAMAWAGLGLAARAEGGDGKVELERARAVAASTEPVDDAQHSLQEGLRLRALVGRPERARRARRCFARAMARDLLAPGPALELARLAVAASSLDVAVALAERALAVDPTCREAHELLGLLLARDLPAAPDVATGRPEARRDLARAEGCFDAALALARAPEDVASARFGRALARRGQGRLEGARDDLLAAAEAARGDLRVAPARCLRQALAALELLAEVCAQLGEPEAVADAQGRAVALRRAATEAALEAVGEGQALRDRRSLPEAIARFDRALELDPALAQAHHERGGCHLKAGRFIPGVLDLARALELDPGLGDRLFERIFRSSPNVDLRRVLQALDLVVGDHPDAAHAVFLRGLFRLARTENARVVERDDVTLGIADLDRALALSPRFVAALLCRGLLRCRQAALLPASDVAGRRALLDAAQADYAAGLQLHERSGMGRFLLALLWTARSTEEGLADAEREELRRRALAELEAALDLGFEGLRGLREERGLDPLRGEPGFPAGSRERSQER